MAPTICSDKEYRSQNRLRESIQKQSQNNSVNYGGKITHRRSIAARNAKSIKFSIVNSFENDTTMYDSIIDNNNNNQNIRHSINLSLTRNRNHDDEFDEKFKNSNTTISSTSSSSILSFSSICDRLTPNQFFNTNLNENCNNLYSYEKQSNFNHRNDSIYYDTSSSSSQSNCIPVITSTVSIGDSNDMKNNKNFTQTQQSISDKKDIIKTGPNSKGLVDIALKTITLIRRNQLLQKKLLQLQVETKEFIQSVMANPENRAFSNKQFNEQSLLSQNNNN